MNWRPARFTRHYTLGLVGGIGFGFFLALSVLPELVPSASFPWKLVGIAGLMAAAITQFLYVGEMKRLHQAESGRAEPLSRPADLNQNENP
ncbi:MAG: hypothetical protein ACRCZF_00875 [Gemmataceae bacterium]